MTEEMSGSSHPVFLGRHKATINSMVYSKESRVLLVGDNDSSVVQYDLKQGRSFGRILRVYKDLGLKSVVSSNCFRNVAVFGGINYKFGMVDISKRTQICDSVETSTKDINCLLFYRVKETTLLFVLGLKPYDYSNGRTDIFNLSTFKVEY